jgi:hypothetical protein
MKYGLAILGGVLAGALLTATAITGLAAQAGSTTIAAVRRAEPFTRLTTRRIEPVDPASTRMRSVRTTPPGVAVPTRSKSACTTWMCAARCGTRA